MYDDFTTQAQIDEIIPAEYEDWMRLSIPERLKNNLICQN